MRQIGFVGTIPWQYFSNSFECPIFDSCSWSSSFHDVVWAGCCGRWLSKFDGTCHTPLQHLWAQLMWEILFESLQQHVAAWKWQYLLPLGDGTFLKDTLTVLYSYHVCLWLTMMMMIVLCWRRRSSSVPLLLDQHNKARQDDWRVWFARRIWVLEYDIRAVSGHALRHNDLGYNLQICRKSDQADCKVAADERRQQSNEKSPAPSLSSRLLWWQDEIPVMVPHHTGTEICVSWFRYRQKWRHDQCRSKNGFFLPQRTTTSSLFKYCRRYCRSPAMELL